MKINSVSYFVFLLFIVIAAFQSSALGISEGVYSVLGVIEVVLVLIVFLLSVRMGKSLMYFREFLLLRLYIWVIVVFVFIWLILNMLDVYMEFQAIRDLMMSFLFLLIGLNEILTEEQFVNIINIYMLSYLFAALSIVFTFSSGFVIDQYYLPVPKNQLAPAFAIAMILSEYFAFKMRGMTRFYYYFISALFLASLLVLRGRSAIVAVFIVNVIFFLFYIKNKRMRLFFTSALALVMPYLWSYFYDAMFLNYDISDLDSVSSGRNERNIAAIQFILKHPFFGSLDMVYNGGLVHNYVLITFVSYGIILGSIIFLVYFRYISIIISAIKMNAFLKFQVGPLVMVVPFIVSLFEYSYPYAPGNAVFFSFFLMGQYLQKNRGSSQNLMVW